MSKGRRKKIILWTLCILIMAGATGAWIIYDKIYGNNVNLGGKKQEIIYIPHDAGFKTLVDTLESKNILKNTGSFRMVAKRKGLDQKIKPGRYRITQGMSNNDLCNMFRSGNQYPLSITFNNIRTRDELAEKVGGKLEIGTEKLKEVLNNEEFLKKYGLNKDNITVIFIPNTYEIYWNISAEEFVDRMYKEYQKFWTNERTKKAEAAGLTPVEVSVLASIVQAETNKWDEMPRVAGVYINRLHRGMLLQADPTVVFAIGDFTIKRVLKRHLEFDSPYNTYKYPGLPPGPINLPNPKTIDKVLDYEKHSYIYFCAKEDFSGYHNFAVTASEHSRNAQRYQQALNIWMKKQKGKDKN